MFIEILRSFAENTPEELDKLRDVNETNLPLYAIDIHTIKGVSASIGAKEISVRAKGLEKMAKDGNLSGILAENDDLISDAEALVASIQEWLAANAPG